MSCSVLFVEDDPNLGFVVRDNLTKSGYIVYHETDGDAALRRFSENPCDICVLDVMLPKRDGFSVAEGIRKTNNQVPILFLTAKSMHEDKVKGFKLGGDDYLTKPFHFEELLLRLEALAKRIRRDNSEKEHELIYNLGKYMFDYKNFNLIFDNTTPKVLTKKEAELLKLLCDNKNEVLQRDTALLKIWGSDDYFLGRSMDVFITRLRKYLKQDASIEIQAVHGVGFKLVDKLI